MAEQRTLILTLVLLAPSAVLAALTLEELSYPRGSDFLVLPKYCDAKLNKPDGDPEKLKWGSTLGPDFIHVHHYCAGLNFMNRANKMVGRPHDRKELLTAADGEFRYLMTHATPQFSLMPEIAMNRGLANVRLEKGAEAAKYFYRAVELKPDYAAAYGALSDYYRDLGNIAEARKIVQEGLAKVPDAKGLQRRQAELESMKPGKPKDVR